MVDCALKFFVPQETRTQWWHLKGFHFVAAHDDKRNFLDRKLHRGAVQKYACVSEYFFTGIDFWERICAVESVVQRWGARGEGYAHFQNGVNL